VSGGATNSRHCGYGARKQGRSTTKNTKDTREEHQEKEGLMNFPFKNYSFSLVSFLGVLGVLGG
jgi:hypothetical protein